MGSKDNLESYISLSRKELQGLCKKYKLPANRSHAELAKSLSSHIKKKIPSPASSKERSSSYRRSSFCTLVADPKLKGIVTLGKETSIGENERTNSSGSKSTRLVSIVKEKVDGYRRHSMARNQMENSRVTEGETLKKVRDAALNVLCTQPTNNETTEGFGCSTSEPRDGDMIPLVANVEGSKTVSQLAYYACHDDSNKNDSQNFKELRKSGEKLLIHAATDCGNGNLVPALNTHGRSDAGTRFLSPHDISTNVPPSFQFFVRSEEGLNLYVDLDSSPSEWIDSLKEGVCTNQKVQHCKSGLLCDHSRSLVNLCDHMKTSSSGNAGADIQNNFVESGGCTNSSLSSAVSENCHSEANPPDATVVTSRSLVLTSNRSVVETSGYLEGNQLLSSSCAINSDVQNNKTFNSASCSRDMELLPRGLVDASLCTETSNESTRDTFLRSNKTINLLSHDAMENPDRVDLRALKIASVDPKNVDCSLVDTLANVSKKESSPVSTGILGNIEASCLGSIDNKNEACHVSTERECIDGFSEASGNSNRLSNSCQLNGQLLLDCPSTDAQSDVGSAGHPYHHYSCGSLDSSASEDPTSALEDELGGGIIMKEKEGLEYSQFKSYLFKTCKRSCSQGLPEELQSKRQHSGSENKGETVMNLRSTKTWAKESICGLVVLPRRSTRLVSKCDQSKSTS